MEKMLEEVKYCKNVIKYKFNKALKMTEKDEINFKKADSCHICNQKYTVKDIRVRDHCHVTQKYRGSAHQDRNLNFRLTDKIPVITGLQVWQSQSESGWDLFVLFFFFSVSIKVLPVTSLVSGVFVHRAFCAYFLRIERVVEMRRFLWWTQYNH